MRNLVVGARPTAHFATVKSRKPGKGRKDFTPSHPVSSVINMVQIIV